MSQTPDPGSAVDLPHHGVEPGDEHGNAYDGLHEHDGEASGQWAFGQDFEDPLAGVDTTLPAGADGAVVAAYCLMLADDALVASHRLSEWSSRAPDLEEDIALSNIALDLLGQARLLLARAAAADASVVPRLPEGSPVPPEDALAFFREAHELRNVRLAELPNGDFAHTQVRLLLTSLVRVAVLERLRSSRDTVLAAVAAKGVKELAYHRDHAARWIVTLARGTEESRSRTVAALDALWPYLPELLADHEVERAAAEDGLGVAPSTVADEVHAVLEQVLAAAGLERPERGALAPVNGRTGRDGLGHTEHLGRMLAEMQVVARAHPGGPVVSVHGLVAGQTRDAARAAYEVAAAVLDPELPVLTLADLGVLREVRVEGGPDTGEDTVVVTITPTYSGCPAMATMRDDLVHRLQRAGWERVRVDVQLSPAWSSDWISERGRRALEAHGVSPPGPAPEPGVPVPLTLTPVRRAVRCPRCAGTDAALVSEFGATACKALYRCRACAEPFEHVKEI